MFTRMPAANIVMTSAEPPNETNGSGMPVTGQQADDRADVDDGLPDDPHGDAGREQRAEAVGRAQRGAHAEHRRRRRTAPITRKQPMRPSSSPMMAKMKSVCAFGQEVPLGPARAEPDAGEPAAAERDQRLRDLVARVRRVGERVEEGEHPRPPVGLDAWRGA